MLSEKSQSPKVTHCMGPFKQHFLKWEKKKKEMEDVIEVSRD